MLRVSTRKHGGIGSEGGIFHKNGWRSELRNFLRLCKEKSTPNDHSPKYLSYLQMRPDRAHFCKISKRVVITKM